MLQPRIWPDDIPDFPTRIDADWKLASTVDDRAFLLGFNRNGMLVSWDTSTTPHLLVQGRAGSGKSSLMQVPAVEALLRDYQLVVIDPIKGSDDFRSWAEKRSIAFIGQGDFRGTEAALLWVDHEMSRRVDLMVKHGFRNITDIPESERPPRILVVFDEFGGYLNSIGKIASNPTGDPNIEQFNRQIEWKNASIRRTCSAVARIAIQGRTTGVSLLLSAQHATRRDFDSIINGKALFKILGKIVLGRTSLTDIVSPVSLAEANVLQKMPDVPGRGIYETSYGYVTNLQSWWSGGNDAIEGVLSGVPAVEKVDISGFLPSAIE